MIPADRVQAAQELTTGLLQRTESLGSRGIAVDPNSAANGLSSRTTRALTIRELTGIVNDTPAERVSPAQIAALRERNPHLAGDNVPAETRVDLSTTAVGLNMALAHLGLMQHVLAGRAAAGEDVTGPSAAIERRLGAVGRALGHVELARSLAGVDANLGRIPPHLRGAAIGPAYEHLRRELDQRVAQGQISGEDAQALRTRLGVSEAEALGRHIGDHGDRFVADVRARVAQLTRIPDVGARLERQLANDRNTEQERTAAVASIERSRDQAIARLQQLPRTPQTGAAIDAQIARLRQEATTSMARIHVAAGDHRAAERLLLPESLTRQGALPAPTANINVGNDGRPQTGVQPFINPTTLVGTLDPTARDAALQRVAALPDADRRQAIDGMLALADIYARDDDRSRLGSTRQLLLGAAERFGDAGVRARVDMVDARYSTRVGDFDNARAALDRAMAHARTVPGDAGRGLQVDAVAGMIAVHQAAAAAATDDATRDAAAQRLRDLRVSMQGPDSPLSREQQARLVLLEAQTFLERHQSPAALESLRALERYGDLPWAAATADAFRRDNSEAGITAAIKVGMRVANSSSMALTVGTTLGGGLTGLGIGFVMGGPPGAAVGLALGSGVGGLGASSIAVAQNWDRVTAAYRTGLTSLSLTDGLTDGAFAALNLASIVPPAAGVARAVELLRGPALMERAAAVLGPGASRELVTAHAGRILADEFLAAAGRTGAPLGVAATTLLGTQIATEYARIEGMPPGERQDAARRQFAASLADGTLIAATAVGTAALATRLAAVGGRRWPAATAFHGSEPHLGGVSPTSLDVLQSRAVAIRGTDEIPGGPGGAHNAGDARSTHYLLTRNIFPGDLPYSSGLRPPEHLTPLPTSLDQVPIAPVGRITGTVLASEDYSGSTGHIRLATLADGRPVVIKTIFPYGSAGAAEHVAEATLAEARSLQLQSQLGFGPRFHGIVRDGDRFGLVMDIVPGDFRGTPVTPTTFRDLETILSRLERAGARDLGDFQLYRTQTGNLLSIDAGHLVDRIRLDPYHPPNSEHGGYTRQRLSQLGHANPALGLSYLEGLRVSSPEAHAGLVRAILGIRADESPFLGRLQRRYSAYARRFVGDPG